MTERPLDQRGGRSLPFAGGCFVALGLVLMAFGGLFALAVGLVAVFATRAIPWEQRWLIPPALLFVVIMGGGLLRIDRAAALGARPPPGWVSARARWQAGVTATSLGSRIGPGTPRARTRSRLGAEAWASLS